MCLEIRSHDNKYIICVVYRAPSGSIILWERLQEAFDMAMDHSNIAYIMIIGHLNTDPQVQEGRKHYLFAESNILTLHLTEPIRIIHTLATVVD